MTELRATIESHAQAFKPITTLAALLDDEKLEVRNTVLKWLWSLLQAKLRYDQASTTSQPRARTAFSKAAQALKNENLTEDEAQLISTTLNVTILVEAQCVGASERCAQATIGPALVLPAFPTQAIAVEDVDHLLPNAQKPPRVLGYLNEDQLLCWRCSQTEPAPTNGATYAHNTYS